MPNESTTRIAVVVGATGIIGRAIAAKLAGLGGWRVLGVTRSGGTVPGVDEAIAVDLTGFATGNPMNLALRSPSTHRSSARPVCASISRVPRRPWAP
jgi:NAD(P)-dependent dehydrogenase (short-subunit alcohol dehydrogenase family)